MSELTRCNFCTHKSIMDRAMKDGMKATMVQRHDMKTLYVYPPGVDREVATADKEDGEPSEYFAAAFMELTTHCCC